MKSNKEGDMENRVNRALSMLAILVAASIGWAGIASSQTLSLDDQTAMAVGDPVTFTLSIDYPSSQSGNITSVTLDINFDQTVLTPVPHPSKDGEVDIARGSLVTGWEAFGVSNPQDGVLKVVGLTFTPANAIEPGHMGAIVEIRFTVASMTNDTLTITATEPANFTTEDGEFTFHMNTPPTVRDDMGETVEGEAVTIDVLANDSDADMDTLTVTAVTQGASGTVVNNNGADVTYTPNMGFTGSDNFTYTVSDGTDADTAMVMVTVTARPEPPNTAPTAANDTAMTDEDVAVMIDVLDNDSDSEGDTLTVTVVTQGGSGTVVNNNDGTVTYTPNAGYSGMDSFMYTVSDGELDATATVSVTVEAAEEPVDPDNGDNGGGGGGGCTLNPGAPFDPTLLSVLALFMGIHVVRRFTRRQSLR